MPRKGTDVGVIMLKSNWKYLLSIIRAVDECGNEKTSIFDMWEKIEELLDSKPELLFSIADHIEDRISVADKVRRMTKDK